MLLPDHVKQEKTIYFRNLIYTMEKLSYYFDQMMGNINGKLLKMILVMMTMIQTILLISIYKTEMLKQIKIIDLNSFNVYFTSNTIERR